MKHVFTALPFACLLLLAGCGYFPDMGPTHRGREVSIRRNEVPVSQKEAPVSKDNEAPITKPEVSISGNNRPLIIRHEVPVSSNEVSISRNNTVSISSNYESPLPENYREIIKEDFSADFSSNMFFGSTAPVYQFSPPIKGHTEENRRFHTKRVSGWVVCGTMDRKKKLGGYSGYSGPVPFYVLFKDGRIAAKLVGQSPHDEDSVTRSNEEITRTCAGAEKNH